MFDEVCVVCVWYGLCGVVCVYAFVVCVGCVFVCKTSFSFEFQVCEVSQLAII